MGNTTVPEEYHIPPQAVVRLRGRGAYLGKGGFGQVFKGELRVGVCVIPVAIKRILVSSDQDPPHGVARKNEVEREIFNMAKVCHENLLKIYGGFYDETDDPTLLKANVILEYCPGGNLGTWLQRQTLCQSITSRHRILAMLQVARGLHHLHNLDSPIAHRDLSRDNVLATTTTTDAVMKICDFGLSRHVDSVVTRVEVGKCPYMPPTFYAPDRRVDDIFSFGVLLWEIWTGKKAYSHLLRSGADQLQLYADVKRGLRPSSPHRDSDGHDYFGEEISPELHDLICLCWDSDPLKRPEIGGIIEILEGLVRQVWPTPMEILQQEKAVLESENERLQRELAKFTRSATNARATALDGQFGSGQQTESVCGLLARLKAILRREWLALRGIMRRIGEDLVLPVSIFPQRRRKKPKRQGSSSLTEGDEELSRDEYKQEIELSETDSDLSDVDFWVDSNSEGEEKEEDFDLTYVQLKLNQARHLAWEAELNLAESHVTKQTVLQALQPLLDIVHPFKELFQAYSGRLRILAMDNPSLVSLVARLVQVQEKVDLEMVDEFGSLALASSEEEEGNGEEEQLDTRSLRLKQNEKQQAQEKYGMKLLHVLFASIREDIVSLFDEERRKRFELKARKEREMAERAAAKAERKRRKTVRANSQDSSFSDSESEEEESESDEEEENEALHEEEEQYFSMEQVLTNIEENVVDLPHIRKLIAAHFADSFSIMKQFVVLYFVHTKMFIIENVGSKVFGANLLTLIKWIRTQVFELFQPYVEEFGINLELIQECGNRLEDEFLRERTQKLRKWQSHLINILFRKWEDDSIRQDPETFCVYTRGPYYLFQFLGGSILQLVQFDLPNLLENMLGVSKAVLLDYGQQLVEGLVEYRSIFTAHPTRYVPIINDFSLMGRLLGNKKEEILSTGIFDNLLIQPNLEWMTNQFPESFMMCARDAVEEFRLTLSHVAQVKSRGLFSEEWMLGEIQPFETLLKEMKGIYMAVDCLETQFKKAISIIDVILITYFNKMFLLKKLTSDHFSRMEEDVMLLQQEVEDVGGSMLIHCPLVLNLLTLMQSRDIESVIISIGKLQRYPDFSKEICLAFAEIGGVVIVKKRKIINQLYQNRPDDSAFSQGRRTFFSKIKLPVASGVSVVRGGRQRSTSHLIVIEQ